jgi:short-subunit dehydrogenase
VDIQNKVVIITGASEGIGRAAAVRFAAAGAKLALVARSIDKLNQLAGELRQSGCAVQVVPTDMRDPHSVQGMVNVVIAHFGQVDVLVNNAGQAVAGTIAEINTDDMHQIMELNVFGPIYATQAVVPYMRQAGGGIIVNISSMTSKMNIPGLAGYAASKAALNLLSQTGRVELAGDNIRVLLVLPRRTATEFGHNSLGNRDMRNRQRQGGENSSIDSAEYVAERIFEAVRDETAEKYME